jgi:hypothetical protein
MLPAALQPGLARPVKVCCSSTSTARTRLLQAVRSTWYVANTRLIRIFSRHALTISHQADAEDIKAAGTSEFTFKLHGHKHKFDAQTGADRDGWLEAVKKIAEEAKAKKDEIVSSEGYKEALAKLSMSLLSFVHFLDLSRICRHASWLDTF